MKWVITADPTDIKELIREYYKQLYTDKFDSLSEMDQQHKLLQPTQYEIDNLNNTITVKEICN